MNHRDKYKVHILKAEIPKLNLPAGEFDMEKVVNLLKKKHPGLWAYYPSNVGEMRVALDELAKDGFLTSRYGSKKMTNGSKTEIMYTLA